MSQSKNLKPWTDKEAETVEDMLTCFNGAREVCAQMRCRQSDLNWLCRQAFGESFRQAQDRFQTIGRSLLRRAMFNAATEGNAKALDTLVREQLGIDPVSSRRKTAKKVEAKKDEEVDF